MVFSRTPRELRIFILRRKKGQETKQHTQIPHTYNKCVGYIYNDNDMRPTRYIVTGTKQSIKDFTLTFLLSLYAYDMT
jgi:hypothetical protein